MQFKDYKIFGLDQSASLKEMEEAYARLKAQYSEDRFKEGEEGNNASRRLMELENAYAEYRDGFAREEKQAGQTGEAGEDYEFIDSLIKEGRLEEAQSRLDNMRSRTAEWHYLQAIIFYKRSWFAECRKQLQLALAIEPFNSKYRAAAEKLELFLGNIRLEDNMGQRSNGVYSEGYDPRNNSACNNPANCCYPVCCCSPFCC